MLRSIFFAAAITLPAMVFAQDDANWRECQQDSDCIAVQGTCDLTAVNVAYKDDAVTYYRKLHANSNCVKRFWEPTKGMIPECKPISGSKMSENSQVVPHSVCAMVPKPVPKH